MFTVDMTIVVNSNSKPDLTQTDVWRGLILKDENAMPFVPVMEACDVVERGTIFNEILDQDGELTLRYSFTLAREDMEDGSDEEKAYAAGMEDTYLKAVQYTIDTIRRLKAEGELPAT